MTPARMKDEIEALLGGYAAGILTDAERARLLDAALRDQEVFDALAAELRLKELLDDPVARGQVRAALESRAGRRPAWLSLPAWAGAAAAAGIVVVALALLRRPAPLGGPVAETPWSSPVARPAASASEQAFRRLFELPLRPSAATLTVVGDGPEPRFLLGSRIRFEVLAHQAGNLLLLEEREDGSLVVRFPADAQPFSRVAAGDAVEIPPAPEPGFRLEPPAGPRRLRLAVLPVDVDPLTLTPSRVALLQARIGLVEHRFLVVP
jgi:hypothetical protein